MTNLVARQPIFNRTETVYGYELLFRSSLDNFFCSTDGEAASRTVADHFITLGQSLTQGRMAFINCTAQFLLRGFVMFLPQASTVVEILETVDPDPEVLSACRKLKRAGYTIALDDFEPENRSRGFVGLADIIKVDFLQTPSAMRKALIEEFAPRGVRMLAEKVETREEFEDAQRWGYDYFQGNFFSRPQIVPGRRLPLSKLNGLRILQAVFQAGADLAAMERAITPELPICYKLLRYVNSPFLGLRSEVRSVRHALALLGTEEVRKLVSLSVALSISEGKPPELMATGLIRARSCEILASHLARRGFPIHTSNAFLVGMFSVIDALLGRELTDVLEQVALPDEAREALTGGRNSLRQLFELVLAHEAGNWSEAASCLEKLHLDEAIMPAVYMESLEWVRRVTEFSGEATAGAEPKAPLQARSESRSATSLIEC